MPYHLPRRELIVHLEDQIDSLRLSADGYDSGQQGHAKRLATAIRVLLHDAGSSRSLLGQLGVKSRVRWVDTAERINPLNLAPTNGLLVLRVQATEDGQADVQYVPPLRELSGPEPPRRTPFERWWNEPVIKDGLGHLFTRSTLVRGVANKDGGAHVDPELDDDYAALSRLNSLGAVAFRGRDAVGVGLGGSGRPASNNAALAAVRQVAFEVDQTLGEQLRWLLEPHERASFGGDRKRILGSAVCPCGSGRAISSCCLTDSERALALGNELKARGEVDLCIDALEVSSRLGHDLAPFNLGLALAESHDYESAEEAFRVGVSRGDGEAASNLGVLLAERGDEMGAKASYEEGVRLESASAMSNLAQLHLADGDRVAAKELWERGALCGSGEAAFRAANLYREDGKHARAIELYEDARDRGHAKATFNLAQLFKDQGMLEEAMATLDAAVSMQDPVVLSRVHSLRTAIEAAAGDGSGIGG